MEKRDEDLLKEHKLTTKLAKHGGAGGTMRLKGYVGSSDSPDSICLYLNLNFDDCLYIKKDDIVHVEEAPESELEFGGTYIWIKKDSELTHVKTASVKEKASFLEGEIATAQLKPGEIARREFALPARIKSLPVNTCGPSILTTCPSSGGGIFAICQPSFDRPCSTVLPAVCPGSTNPVVCPNSIIPTDCPAPLRAQIPQPQSMQNCPSFVSPCGPSFLRHCPTDPRIDCGPSALVICPSGNILCDPSHLICPTRIREICAGVSGGWQCGGVPEVKTPEYQDPVTGLTEQIRELVDQVKIQNARLKKLAEKEGTG